MTAPSDKSVHRRRRSTSRVRTDFAMIVGRTSKWVAIGAGALFVLLSYKEFRQNYFAFGKYAIGQTKDETIYGFGVPQLVGNGKAYVPTSGQRTFAIAARRWRYQPTSGATIIIDYNAAGRLTRIACGSNNPAPSACPAFFGVRLGDDEDAVVAMLGSPTTEAYGTDSKVVRYAEHGMSLRLTRFYVTQIVVEKPTSALWLLSYLRWAIP